MSSPSRAIILTVLLSLSILVCDQLQGQVLAQGPTLSVPTVGTPMAGPGHLAYLPLVGRQMEPWAGVLPGEGTPVPGESHE